MIKILVLILLFVACERPRTSPRTYQRNNNDSQYFYPPSPYNYPDYNDSNNPSGTNDNSSTGTSSDNTSDPTTPTSNLQGLNNYNKHCSWSQDGMTGYTNHHHLIGDYTVCKSSQEPNKVYFQIQTPTYEHELCFFPTNKEGDSLLYVGSKRCIRPTSTTTIYPLSFSIDRPGFSNFQMNSLIFMPHSMHSFSYPYGPYPISITDAFRVCMDVIAYEGDPTYCQAFFNAGRYGVHDLF